MKNFFPKEITMPYWVYLVGTLLASVLIEEVWKTVVFLSCFGLLVLIFGEI